MMAAVNFSEYSLWSVYNIATIQRGKDMEKLVNVFKNGINYTNYGKANFAIKLLHYGNVVNVNIEMLKSSEVKM